MMRDVLVVLAGFLLVGLQSALGAVTGIGELMPNALLPLVIHLGMAPDVSLARGASLSFVLGAFADAATGHAVGLLTFVHVATLVGTRAAGVRLLMRGRLSQMLITALIALLGALLVLALHAIFRPVDPLTMVSARHLAIAVIAPSLSTGALAPLIFQLARRIDTLRRRDEPASAL